MPGLALKLSRAKDHGSWGSPDHHSAHGGYVSVADVHGASVLWDWIACCAELPAQQRVPVTWNEGLQ